MLNELLKRSFFRWLPNHLKLSNILRRDGVVFSLNLLTISDRVWQCLFRFGLEPAHEASFSSRNLGFRPGLFSYDLQQVFFYNLDYSAFGFQKRILMFNFGEKFDLFNYSSLLRKLIAPRSLKLTIFRFFKVGFLPRFLYNLTDNFYLESLMANILLDGIENLHSSVRFGKDMVFFLKPHQNEIIIIRKVFDFLEELILDLSYLKFFIFDTFEGFNFRCWNFKVYHNYRLVCFPSYLNYREFLLRVKHILNNSNYGVDVKVAKVRPIIQQWFVYHAFSNIQSNKYSLFFLKRRAFKIFNSEAKQDKYSSKRLLDKCFNFKSSFSNGRVNIRHKSFWFDYRSFSGFNIFPISSFVVDYYCIFCGVRINDF